MGVDIGAICLVMVVSSATHRLRLTPQKLHTQYRRRYKNANSSPPSLVRPVLQRRRGKFRLEFPAFFREFRFFALPVVDGSKPALVDLLHHEFFSAILAQLDEVLGHGRQVNRQYPSSAVSPLASLSRSGAEVLLLFSGDPQVFSGEAPEAINKFFRPPTKTCGFCSHRWACVRIVGELWVGAVTGVQAHEHEAWANYGY